LGAGYSDEKLGGSTFNAGVLGADQEHIEVLVDYRCPANEDCEPYLEKIAQVCSAEGLEFEVVKKKQGLYFPEDHELVKTLMGVYEEETGEKASPVNMGGGTYAKSLPNTVAFGSIFPGREDTMHQANEYIDIKDLLASSRIYAKAMMKLANL
ncbi:MAG: M20/M25/M40 family metallo-hydrolase, partial [Clostridia bacterium]